MTSKSGVWWTPGSSRSVLPRLPRGPTRRTTCAGAVGAHCDCTGCTARTHVPCLQRQAAHIVRERHAACRGAGAAAGCCTCTRPQPHLQLWLAGGAAPVTEALADQFDAAGVPARHSSIAGAPASAMHGARQLAAPASERPWSLGWRNPTLGVLDLPGVVQVGPHHRPDLPQRVLPPCHNLHYGSNERLQSLRRDEEEGRGGANSCRGGRERP